MIRYKNNATMLGRFHPILKLFLLISICVSFFMVHDIIKLLLLLLTIAVLYLHSRVSPREVGGFRFFITLSIALIVINLLFTRDGETLFRYGFIIITKEGFLNGIQKTSLLIGVIFSSMLFVATTNTSQFANAIMQMGVPYRYAYMMVTSMSLAPVFQMEASTVRNAQVARGLRIDVGNISKIVNMARFTFMPLIVSALSKVDSLTISMDGRGFGIYKNRSYLKESKIRKMDMVIFISGLAVLTAICAY